MPLLAFLMYIAASSGNALNLIDFGGSLGSSFFQNRRFFKNLSRLNWCVVEQPHFVEIGNKEIAGNGLVFAYDIKSASELTECNAVLLSSVLPYVEKPYDILQELISHKFKYIIIDRTPFIFSGQPDRLTIEHVPPEIYEAAYPAWFLNYDKFISFFEGKYRIVEDFPANDNQKVADLQVDYRAMLLELI
jgi:putative methyltransferase (TIGR04325 family)